MVSSRRTWKTRVTRSIPHHRMFLRAIGLAAAHTLRERGWHVIAACRKPEDVAARIADGFDSVGIDHGDTASVETGWTSAMEITGGRLDALFNNGGHGMSGAAEDVPREALELVFASNVFGVHQLTRLALPMMIAQGHGRIVMHSSVVGYTGAPVAGRLCRDETRGRGAGENHAGRAARHRRACLDPEYRPRRPPGSARTPCGFSTAGSISTPRRHAGFYRDEFMAQRDSDAPVLFEGTADHVVRKTRSCRRGAASAHAVPHHPTCPCRRRPDAGPAPIACRTGSARGYSLLRAAP